MHPGPMNRGVEIDGTIADGLTMATTIGELLPGRFDSSHMTNAG